MAKTTTALGPLSKLLDGDTGQLLGIIDAEGRPFTPLPVLDFTAAQLSAMAAAGGLTPYATYVASDTGVAGFASDASTLNPGINADGDIQSPTGALYALSELTPYVTLTASDIAFTGPCELAGWYCSVAAGTITIYDALSATGTPIVPATALVAGPMPIFGAGTTGKLALTTGCYVVLSGAATVRALVG